MGGINSGRKKGSKTKKILEINGKPHKVCVGVVCNGAYTPVSAFGNHKSYCKECDSQIKKIKHEGDYVGYKYQKAIDHARAREKKGKRCEVAPNFKELIETMRKEQKVCYYSGVKLMEKVHHPNSWSIDRVDYKVGYVPGNMVLCATVINEVKGSIEHSLNKAKNKLAPLYGEEKTVAILKKIFEEIE